ncbi:MAG: GlsB/YeaQ/YmgE family stress response membrane protein [Deltaproteobacteria bacterium]|nr:GlsB/YeaQ/YmgE family stress response membrane protein [Deltaproteobacteria bacterium]
MGIIGWIVFGFVVGLLARAITPGNDSMGFVATSILGIVGAMVAGWLGTALGWYERDSATGIISATIGAIIVLFVYRAATGRRLGGRGSTSDRDRFAA